MFLLRVEGGGVFVKVVDFGISKVLKATTTKLTMARAVVGTPEFMAPEQAAGRVDQVDHRGDQWSLACLAWHMLSARLPFWRPDVHAILEQVIQGEPTPLSRELAHCIPREVDKVLRRALSKRREDWFPTITAFARAFEAAAAGVSVPVPAPRAARSAPPAGRSRTGLWLILGAAALATAGAGWMFRAELMSSKWWPGSAADGRGARGSAVAPSNASDDGDQRRRRPAQRRERP